VATPAESESLRQLFADIADLDAFIADAGWLDAAWEPLGQRWMIRIDIDPGPYAGCSDPGRGEPCPAYGHSIKLPGGTSLTTFGNLYEAGDSPLISADYRCGTVSESEAAELISRLHLSLDPQADNHYREFWLDGPLYEISVDRRPLHDHGCEPPSPSPLSAPGDALSELDPCAYVPDDTKRALAPWGVHGERGLRTADWAHCSLWTDRIEFAAYLRSRPTTTAEADTFMYSAFGEAVAVDRRATGSVYTNICFPDRPGCRSAVALSVEPYFFVLRTSSTLSSDFPPLLELAEGILGDLAKAR